MELGAASAKRLLHGVIDARILEAKLSVTSDAQPKPATSKSQNLSRRKLLSLIKKLPLIYHCQRFGKTTDLDQQGGNERLLYTTIGMDKLCVGRTRAIDATTNGPQWKEELLHIYCAHSATEVVFTVVMIGGAGDPGASTVVVGHAYLPVEDIAEGKPVDRWLPVCDTNRRPLEGLDSVHVQVRFTDVSADPESRWGKGVGRPPVPYLGVPRTFYRQHGGCLVTLYQDAHAAATATPLSAVRSSSCWEDVFDAIANARRLVYIAGWSVDADVMLVRDPRRPAQTLGQLLKKKAGENVAVLVLVSTHGDGVGTAVYFRGTGVQCVLCPRSNVAFAHQQKAVVVDSPRGLVGFVGGLDLCGGRYDTPEHPLFRTLGNVHRDDFHQPSFPGASVLKGGPREPWHDIHCRVEGPAARDVLDNFEQRWRRQGGGDSLLVELPRRSAVSEEAAAQAQQSAESWNVQVFRSIDSSAVTGIPEAPDEAARCGLVTGDGGGAIERSIQDAYIHAIRRAKFFVYVESQRFLGSSHWWLPEDHVGGAAASTAENVDAIHLIPKELSLKITSKIRAGETFRVYVVVPMWPEGEPESASTQAILDWQRRTMEMMYRDVALAMQAKGIQGSPRQYLSFFCLGNREAYSPGEYVAQERPELDSSYMRAQQARRFKINVHGNTMIVDDEYIIVGSANINQRSMDGGRDSEIAIGAYQPQYLVTEYSEWRYSGYPNYTNYLVTLNKWARGQVHQFRLALWREHLGHAAAQAAGNELLNPESHSCMNSMNQTAQRHWDLYASDAFQENLPGHLMAYPVGVSDRGELLETVTFFPDTKAWVFGSSSAKLPPILTT